MSEVLREHRVANYQGFEFVDPDGGTRRDWKAVRGNGVLTLTADELRFVRWLPKKEWVIPLASVTGVEVGQGHNGKRTLGYPVVKVRIADAEGERIFGVLVGRSDDAEAWAEAIRAAITALE